MFITMLAKLLNPKRKYHKSSGILKVQMLRFTVPDFSILLFVPLMTPVYECDTSAVSPLHIFHPAS